MVPAEIVLKKEDNPLPNKLHDFNRSLEDCSFSEPQQRTHSPSRLGGTVWLASEYKNQIKSPYGRRFPVPSGQDCRVLQLNEKYIETKIDELEEIGESGSAYHLTLARITELALICAGNYADNMEFSAAGDLLVNPRQVHVLIDGVKEPILKNRHLGLTQQLKSESETHAETIQWLSRNTNLNIIQQPLLPYVYDRLKNFGTISLDYLQSIDRRMKKIAEVIGFLSAYRSPEPCMYYHMEKMVSKAEYDFIYANLCRFDTDLFFDLGNDILNVIESEQCASRFLQYKNNISTKLENLKE